MITQELRHTFETNPAARALCELRSTFPELGRFVHDHGAVIDYTALIKRLFYGVEYTDDLFSLPMGGWKTFLMAAFIYIGLYLAQNEPDNKVFAHKFQSLTNSGLEHIELIAVDCSIGEGPWHSDHEIKIDKNSHMVRDGKKTKEFWGGTVFSRPKPYDLKCVTLRGMKRFWYCEQEGLCQIN